MQSDACHSGPDSGTVVIAVVMLLMAVVDIVALTFVFGVSAVANVTRRQLAMEQARYGAEAGAESAVAYIKGGGWTPATLTGTVGTAQFAASITVAAVTGAATQAYNIRSVGTVQGIARAVVINGARNQTWAKYAMWSYDNRSIYFITGDKFYGPVHANNQLWFSGSPEFFGEVTSAASTYGGSTNSVIFHQGFILGVPTDTMAGVDFTSLKAQSSMILTGATTIVFQGTNAVITNPVRGWTNYRVGVSSNPVVYVATQGTTAGVVTASGVLGGRMTVVADQDINIASNLTYVSDPATNSASTDALGLIAGRDVVVQTSFPDNGKIYAHIMATGNATASTTDGSFGVASYSTRHPSGSLTVYGGIVQYYRGAVGTFSGNTLASGFAKNYTYDQRFSANPPPQYPTLSDDFTWDTWREGY